ncbi:torsin interacting protein isoform X2 [Augochlora pura]
MNDYSFDEQTEVRKPPTPRARESFRRHNMSGEKLTYHLNDSNNTPKINRTDEFNYTDEEDDENDDDNESFRNFSREFSPDYSFVSACNSPMAAQVRERSCRSMDSSQSFNKANSSYSENHVHKHPKRSILSFNKIFIFSIIMVILYIISTVLSTGETTQEKNVSEINETNTINLMAVEKLLDESMEIIRTKFHNQKLNIWNDIASGIYDVIQDLLNINAEAMRAFHNFCDRQNPLIKKAIYIMTMVVDGYEPFQNELVFVEKQISKQLSGKIDKDVLDPLVTRLTDGVIVPVFPESTITLDKNVCISTLTNKRLIF